MNYDYIIPYDNILVVLVGPSGAGKSTWAREHFHPSEIVSSDAIREELTGDFRRQDKNDQVFDTFYRRIGERLDMGLRVVADATHIKTADRLKTVQVAVDRGIDVWYVVINRSIESKLSTAGWRSEVPDLIAKHDNTFNSNYKSIMQGDFVASNIVELEKETVMVTPMPTTLDAKNLDFIHGLGYRKIRVVGDVHGNYDALVNATYSNERFYIFLGDVVDYGNASWDCVIHVQDMVSLSQGFMIRGNHEKKIANFILKERTPKGFQGKLSHGNEITVNQLKAMSPTGRARVENIFINLVDHASDHLILSDHIRKYMFVHGACHLSMWNINLHRLHKNSTAETYAMYGQTTGKFDDNGYPERIYDWVDDIPSGNVVVCGHDIRSTDAPVIVHGANNGKAVFLDTGCSKGGNLSVMDFNIFEAKNGLQLQESGFQVF